MAPTHPLCLEVVYAGYGHRMLFRDFDVLNAYLDAVQIKAATYAPSDIAVMKAALALYSPLRNAGTLPEERMKDFVFCVLNLSILGEIPDDDDHGTNLTGEFGKCTFACNNYAAMAPAARRAYRANIERLVATATA